MNICSISDATYPWPIDVKITDTRNKSKHFIHEYTWSITNVLRTPRPSKGKSKTLTCMYEIDDSLFLYSNCVFLIFTTIAVNSSS